MIVKQLTRCDLLHIRAALEEFRYWVTEYPETVTKRQEDQLAIAEEIVRHEDIISRHRD